MQAPSQEVAIFHRRRTRNNPFAVASDSFGNANDYRCNNRMLATNHSLSVACQHATYTHALAHLLKATLHNSSVGTNHLDILHTQTRHDLYCCYCCCAAETRKIPTPAVSSDATLTIPSGNVRRFLYYCCDPWGKAIRGRACQVHAKANSRFNLPPVCFDCSEYRRSVSCCHGLLSGRQEVKVVSLLHSTRSDSASHQLLKCFIL